MIRRNPITCAPVLLLAIAALACAGEELTKTQQRWVNSIDAEKGGRYDAAREPMQAIIGQGGDYYMANLRMGWLYYLSADYTNAVTYYRKAAGLAPGSVSPLTGLVNCHLAMKQNGEAVKAAKSILEIDPMNYSANKTLGDVLYASGDFVQAAAYYEKLCALYPEDLTIATSLAWSCFSRGMAKEAAIIFNNVLAVSPNSASARQGLDLCTKPAERAKPN